MNDYSALYGHLNNKHYLKLYSNGEFVRGKARDVAEGSSILDHLVMPLVTAHVPEGSTVTLKPMTAAAAKELGRQVKGNSVRLVERLVIFDPTPQA